MAVGLEFRWLGDKVPCDLFTKKFGTDVADLFNIRRIPANEIVLKPKLLGLEQKVKPWVTEETDPKKNAGKTK